METQSAAVNQDGETITDIQNYLASFNKEIQDNGEQEVATAGSTTASQAQQPASAQDSGDTTYYVAQSGSISGYQSFEQSQGQFDGNTYYTQQYYTSENQQDFTAIPAYTGTATTTGNTASGEIATAVTNTGVQQVAVSLAGGEGQDGLQQIVLAAASENQEGTDGEATEISVTIPASLASQAATEELLQAVEAQSTEPEQPTFVAMQPTAGQSQIRMVVQNSEGIEQQEEVSGSTAGATIVTSDGQEITVSDEGTLQMMANLAEQAAQNSTDGNNQVILNAGNSYQTVTIVPSDTNPGEVSYVLIVSQPEDVKDSAQKSGVNLDMSIYDFNEGEQHTAAADGEDISTGKARIVKISPKKSQAVSQAHMCNYCNYTSPKRYLLSRHMKSHSEERPHKCSVCERGFKTLASLQNHVNTHTGTRPHQCKECDSAFTTSGELVRHVRYKHTHEKPHKCTECDYASVELSKLKRHMRCHTGERPYQCPHCTYASPDTYKLKRHLRIHTGEKPYECDVCHARFTQSNSLKAHKLIHTGNGNKPIFQCELCPTTCGRKTDLRIHVQKLHTSDKPLKCKRCGKSFPDRYTYKVHVKTHEGEKCFKCDLCPYASISQRHLESHMLIHTDQKPYQCEQCDQAFRQKQLLKRHKNLYHNPNYVPPTPKEKTHECPECGRAFRHKGNLIRHMAIHDPEASAQEKAAALRLGRKKLIDTNGEEYTDEEEESEEELDEDDPNEEIHHQLAGQESITLQANQVTTAEGQQVVVLEVIQLQGPEGEQQAVAVVAGGGMDMGPTIQAAVSPEDSSHKVVRRALRRIEPNDVASVSQGEILIDDSMKTPQANTVMVKRGRGRPRRNPLPEPMETEDSELTDKDVIDGEVEENEQMSAETDIDSHGRLKKRRAEEEVFQNQTGATPIKRGRGRPPNSTKARRFRLAPEMLDGQNLPDEAEIARREEEAAKRRLEQKQKDMAECFGFKDDDDEEEETDHVAVHTVTSDAETAMQLLAAMQQVEGELQQ